MYNELNSIFPDHFYFYDVGNMSFGEALERCARLSGDDNHVVNYQGRVIFAAKNAIDVNAISWLNPVAGSPINNQDNIV